MDEKDAKSDDFPGMHKVKIEGTAIATDAKVYLDGRQVYPSQVEIMMSAGLVPVVRLTFHSLVVISEELQALVQATWGRNAVPEGEG